MTSPEGGGDDDGEEVDPFSDEFSPDDQLTPVEKLDKYFQSDDLMERCSNSFFLFPSVYIVVATLSIFGICLLSSIIPYLVLTLSTSPHNTHWYTSLGFNFFLSGRLLFVL